MADTIFCPYCGSSKVKRTAFGYAESVVKDVTTYAAIAPFAMIAHAIPVIGQGAGHKIMEKAEDVSKKNSCEYECKSCNKVFGYSSRGGTKRRKQ